MRRRAFTAAIVCFLLLGVAALTYAAGPATKTPPGAFVTRNINSATELSNLVKTDKVTAERYSRHFGMTPEELATYFRTNLRLSYLKLPAKFTVYYLTRGGQIKQRTTILPAGERMFVDYQGNPVLLVKCGNPLSKFLPKPAPKPVAKVKSVTEVVTDPTVPQVQEMPKLEPIAQMETVAMAMPVEPAIMEPVAEAVLPSAMTFTRAATYALPVLLSAVAVKSSPSSTPVPEPSSLLALAMGASGLAVPVIRRRNRVRG